MWLLRHLKGKILAVLKVALLCFSAGVTRIQMKSIFFIIFFYTQVQHGAWVAADVALLRPVSSQSASSEACSAISGVATQRATCL